MAVLLRIGDFSRMTHLSVKTLRRYDGLGLLVPAAVDRRTGYRSYDVSQVPAAQVIRRLRELGMPLAQVKVVLAASDTGVRNKEIMAHLASMEKELEHTRATVASLLALLKAPPGRPAVEFRSIAATPALAIRGTVTVSAFGAWWMSVFEDLYEAVRGSRLTPAGPGGALYPGELFQLGKGEVTAFVPIEGLHAPASTGSGRVEELEIPAVEVAIMVHHGPMEDLDRTYGTLGTVVAEQAIGVDGPIREYYLTGFLDTDDQSRHRTEVCWPVFHTRAGQAT